MSIADAYVDLHVNGDNVDVETRATLKKAGPKLEKDTHALGLSMGKSLGGSIASALLPSLGAVKFGGIASLGIAAGGSAVQVLSLVGSLKDLAGAAAILPGVLGVAAAAGATLAVGFKGVGTALKSIGDPKKFAEAMKDLAPSAREVVLAFKGLGPAAKDLRLDVQQELFQGLGTVVTKLGTTYLPLLKESMIGVAASANIMLADIGKAITSKAVTSDVSSIFASARDSVEPFGKALASLIPAFSEIAKVGATFLPNLVGGFADAAKTFGAFIDRVSASGQLKDFISTGLSAIGDLAKVAMGAASAINGILKAAQAAGGGTLAVLGTGLEQIAAVINGPAFQAGLTQFFAGLVTGAQGVFSALPAIGSAIAAIAPIIGNLAATAGPILGTALAGLADTVKILAPAFQSLVAAAGPVLNQVFGALSSLIPQLAAALVPLVKVIGAQLGNALTTLAPLLGLVAGAVVQAVAAFAPLVTQLVSALVPILLQVIGTLLPPLVGLFNTLVPIVVSLAQAFIPLTTALAGALIPIAQALVPVIQFVAAALGQLAAAIVPLVAQLVTQLVPVFTQIITAILPVITPLLQILTAVIQAVIPIVLALATAAMPILIQVFSAVIPIIQAVIPIVQALVPVITLVATVISTVAVPAIQILGKIVQAVFSVVLSVITTVIQAVAAAIRVGLTFISSYWGAIWNTAKAVLSGVWSAIKGIISAGVQSIIGFVKGIVAIVGIVRDAWERARSAVSDKIGAVIALAKGLPGKIISAVGNLGSLLFNAGASVVQGLWNGIASLGGWLKSKVLGWVKSVIPGPIASALGIASPSKVAASLAREVPRGLVVGLGDGADNVIKAAKVLAKNAIPGIDPRMATLAAAGRAPTVVATPGSVAAGARPDGMTGATSQTTVIQRLEVTVSVDDLAKMTKIAAFLDMLDRSRIDARRTLRSGTVTT